MKIHQVQQISESHCGPAVLQMLLDVIGIEVTQNRIVEVLDAEDKIEESGVRPDQLGTACVLLAPETRFWYKYNSTLDDVSMVLDLGYAVGVEWQGLFYDSEEQEMEDYDDDQTEFGHYSIISFYDKVEGQLIMVDPYKDFINQDRIIDADMFVRRWWDTNEVENFTTGKNEFVTDEKFLFFVTPKEVFFPRNSGFKVFQGHSSSIEDAQG